MLLKSQWAQKLWNNFLKEWEAHERGEYKDPETGELKVCDRTFVPLYDNQSSTPDAEAGTNREAETSPKT